MNPIFIAIFLCLAALASGSTIIDESNWNLAELAMLSPAERWGTPLAPSNSWGAPIGADGRVVDTSAVAAAKAGQYPASPIDAWNGVHKAAWSPPSPRSWTPSPNAWSNRRAASWAPANTWSQGSASYNPKPSYHGHGQYSHGNWY